MVAEVECENSVNEIESDEELFKDLVSKLFDRVDKIYQKKLEQTAGIKFQEDSGTMPLGGNTERQKLSGLMVVRDLRDKLELMNSSSIDLKSVDYLCISKVLKFLERCGEDWSRELSEVERLSRLQRIEQQNDHERSVAEVA